MNKSYFRKCPQCNKELGYTSKKECSKAEKIKSLCRQCSPSKRSSVKKFFRNCPSCGKELGHTSKKTRNYFEMKKILCHSCMAKIVTNTVEFKQKASKRMSGLTGDKNPFYGRKHSKETVVKIKKCLASKDYSYTKTKEFTDKTKHVGKDNGMFGKSIFSVWVKKYGREVAEQKAVLLKEKASENFRGEKNPMFGKPSPKGSGNGWSGWYKGWYFRSLRELSYMIYFIEKNDLEWESADSKNLYIPYFDLLEIKRTYRADFLINKKFLVEIKPKKLMETAGNVLKKEAAIAFCKENNLEYQIVDPEVIQFFELINLCDKGLVILTKKYSSRLDELRRKIKIEKFSQISAK